MRLLALVALTAGCGRFGFGDPSDARPAPGDAALDALDALDAPAGPPSGELVAFHFDENGGTHTTSTGLGLTGAFMGTVTWVPGKRGSAIHVAALSYVDLAHADPLALSNALTISAWYRLDADLVSPQCMPILIHGSGGMSGPSDNDLYAVNLIPPNLVFYSEHGNQQSNPSTALAPTSMFGAGTWHHVVAVRGAGGDTTFYVDGAAGIAGSGTLPINGGSAGHLRIGGDVDSGSCASLVGALDEIYLYARALDAGEAHALFDAG